MDIQRFPTTGIKNQIANQPNGIRDSNPRVVQLYYPSDRQYRKKNIFLDQPIRPSL